VLIAEAQERGLGETRTRNEPGVLKRSRHRGWKLRVGLHAFAADSSRAAPAYHLREVSRWSAKATLIPERQDVQRRK